MPFLETVERIFLAPSRKVPTFFLSRKAVFWQWRDLSTRSKCLSNLHKLFCFLQISKEAAGNNPFNRDSRWYFWDSTKATTMITSVLIFNNQPILRAHSLATFHFYILYFCPWLLGQDEGKVPTSSCFTIEKEKYLCETKTVQQTKSRHYVQETKAVEPHCVMIANFLGT